jgi:hypothetical protein
VRVIKGGGGELEAGAKGVECVGSSTEPRQSHLVAEAVCQPSDSPLARSVRRVSGHAHDGQGGADDADVALLSSQHPGGHSLEQHNSLKVSKI